MRGWPAEVMGALETLTAELVEESRVKSFYLGHTNDVTLTRSKLDCDDIVLLYETNNLDHAVQVREMLMDTYAGHEKQSKNIHSARDMISEDYVCYVYIALWHNP
jgi:hypothetical protein